MRLFHGSYDNLEPGTLLTGREDNYEKDWSKTDFYKVLESYRPDNMIPHKSAVFLCHHPDDIDAAGGGTEYLCEVKPYGKIQRHCLNWCTRISNLLELEEEDYDEDAVEKAAKYYWEGIPHPYEEPIWEYIVERADVISCYPFEDAFLDDEIPADIDDSTFHNFQSELQLNQSRKKMKM